jgi:2-dehydro-3-deoxygalactonokinase
MNIAIIDCGTTNSRIYIVDSRAHVLYRASIKVGVRDMAISGNNKALKDGLRRLFEHALQETNLQVSDIHCILSSGMISSEIGLLEVPHLWAPCSVDDLARNLQPYVDPSVFPASIPVYFIRGIKNAFDPKTICLRDIDSLDFMRGEETQIVGLLEDSKINLPFCVVVLSSHTKFIPVDAQCTILGSVTTLSGQLYEAILKETIIGKSLLPEGMGDSDFFDAEIVESARNEIEKSGLLRGLLLVRFFDTLLHTSVHERHLLAESLLAAEDMRALPSVEKLAGQLGRNFVLIGQAQRCRVYEYLLRHMPGNSPYIVHTIADPIEIDSLSIRGALALAKKAGIIEDH